MNASACSIGIVEGGRSRHAGRATPHIPPFSRALPLPWRALAISIFEFNSRIVATAMGVPLAIVRLGFKLQIATAVPELENPQVTSSTVRLLVVKLA